MVHRAIKTAFVYESCLCLRKAGPLFVTRCLLKQGEPKHEQTQVMRPVPSDLCYSSGAVYKKEVPWGAVNGWYLTSRLYQFVIRSLHCDPLAQRLR